MNSLVIDDMPELYKELEPYITYMESLDIHSNHEPIATYFVKGDRDNFCYFNSWSLSHPSIISKSCIANLKAVSKSGFTFYASSSMYIADLVSGRTFKPFIEVFDYEIKETKTPIEGITIWEYDNPRIKKPNAKLGTDPYKYKSVIVDNFDDFKKAVDKAIGVYKQVMVHNREVECKVIDV